MTTSSSLTPHTSDSINQAGRDDALHDNNVDFEKPTNKKAEKTKRKRKESSYEDVVVFLRKKMEILEEVRVQGKEIIRIEEEKMNMKREKFRLDQLDHERILRIEEEKMNMEREKLRLQRLDRDERIMKIDTSGMSQIQQKYWGQRQMDILEKLESSN
ncbi:exocyst complex component SEC3-like [Corylus avellana]|uniref:exocyst complex component SEC3-like n=1 Tax=Corylus avellana TaxID=13451 RepID=UPI001E214FDC|nr:exocyst complex component SEC3-like [Corylus avellana]